jgi:hypothetical protein
MTPAKQKEYIAKHPNSIYAKGMHTLTKVGKARIAREKKQQAKLDKIKAEITQLANAYSDASDRYEYQLEQLEEIRRTGDKAKITAASKAADKAFDAAGKAKARLEAKRKVFAEAK